MSLMSNRKGYYMNNLCGFLGLFQPPLNGDKSSIYCVATPDMRALIMVPLVPNFFETAYSVAREPKYQRIFVVLPSLNMQFISDAYLFYYEIGKLLNKKIEFFSSTKPRIPITENFYSHIHICNDNKSFHLTDYMNMDEDFNIKIDFRNKYPPLNSTASDIFLSTNGNRVLFCNYMSEAKLKDLEKSNEIEYIDKIYMPFMKNLYGGLNYIEIKKLISARYISKLHAFGFASKTEAEWCASGVGQMGEVRYDDFV